MLVGFAVLTTLMCATGIATVLPGRPGVLPAAAATAAAGGINVEPSARPWQYLGANPDSWWCPTASQCTTSNPLGRIDTEMSLAQQLHVANVRLEIPWFLVEPSKGGYDWTRADYIFNSATSHGIVIQPILVYTPSWDGSYNSFPVAADFQSFVTAFMGRYGGRVNAVEMWNEPDGGQSLASNNPALYVKDILIPGYYAVKSIRPSVRVIEGGSINDSGTCCAWLSGIYNAGGGSYFDIAAFHDYGGNYAQIVQQYQGVMSAHGQNKPIWMGEYGVSDSTGAQQSSLIRAALTSTPGLAMAQFYTLRDESVYTCCPPASTGEHKLYGVVASDDVTKKTSFFTMQSLLGGSSPPPPPPPSPTPPTKPPAATPPTQASPLPSARPTPSKAAVSPTHTPSPTPDPASAGPGGGPPGGGTGTASSSPIPIRLVSAIRNGGLQIVDFALLVVGAFGVLLGLALAMNFGGLAARSLASRPSILAHGYGVGFGVATGGAMLCLLGILLMSQLPGSG